MYKGIGSVVVGSAPGGEFIPSFPHSRGPILLTAAAFFSTYEWFKKNLPFSDRLAPVKHMISASVGEVVR